jgi:hypothetical protein
MSSMKNQFSDDQFRFVNATALCLVTFVVLCLSGCDDTNDSTGFTSVFRTEGAEGKSDDGELSATEEDTPKPAVSKGGPWPKAVVPENTHGFGRMRLGGPDQEYKFTISNEGDAPLELVAGKSTCQCTKFAVDRTTVGPGEFATLTIKWQAKQENPNFNHGGKVFTNDPDQTSLSFDVHGIIESSIITKPQSVWSVGNIVGDTSGVMEGSLFSRIIPKLTIANVSAETDATSAEYTPMTDLELKTNEALCGWTFKVTVLPEFPVGKLHDTLTIAFDELEDDVEVTVQATRPGDIRINAMKGTRFNKQQRLLSLGQFQAAKGHKAELMLIVNQSNFDEELKFLEVEADPKSLRVSLEPIGKRGEVAARYRMTVEILPGGMRSQRSKGNEGTIRCRTNHPKEQEIVILARFNAF